MSATASQPAVSPTVISNLVRPGFPFAKVFSVYFVEGQMVFARVGSGGTNAAGTLRASLGGATPTAMIAGAIGSLLDDRSASGRSARTSQLANQEVARIVSADEYNFALPLAAVSRVEIKGPNWFRELKVIIEADGKHQFRIDKQSAVSARIIASAFELFLPGKVFFV